MTQPAMLCHLLLLHPVLREAATAESLTGLDRRVTSLSIRDEEKVPTFSGRSHFNWFPSLVGSDLLLTNQLNFNALVLNTQAVCNVTEQCQ